MSGDIHSGEEGNDILSDSGEERPDCPVTLLAVCDLKTTVECGCGKLLLKPMDSRVREGGNSVSYAPSRRFVQFHKRASPSLLLYEL